MDKFSLLTATAVILVIFSITYVVVFRDMKRARYWRTWATANIVLAASLIFSIVDVKLPATVIFLVSNALALTGFALHWNAVRQFNGCAFCRDRVWMPAAIMTAISLPAIALNNYAFAFTVTNVLLAYLVFRIAREYTSAKVVQLSSRHGLAFAYTLIGGSFAISALDGLVHWRNSGTGLPEDLMQSLHLVAALVYASASGAFSLAIAYERAIAEQREAAHRDPLTGVYNRRRFELKLKELLARKVRPPFAVLQFDLDHFKQVNDRFGHVAGDEALQICADLIKWHLRDDDCLARLGGEEFAALLPDISQEEAIAMAEKIRETIAETRMDFAPPDFRLTLSAGVYHGSGFNEDHKALMRCVDEGLYRSKNQGRNRVCLAGSVAAA